MQLFSSRDTQYRCPFGAVEQGTPVHFRICLPRHIGCHGAVLLCCRDQGMEETIGMFWAGMASETEEWWECHFTPALPDLYWYAFRLDTANGQRFLCREFGGMARLSETPGNRWQLTCYQQQFATPDWLSGGTMYQIFPDRFAKKGPTPDALPEGRVMHKQWCEPPVWEADKQGVIRNNDFFGGNLQGVIEKLPYLQSLGVTCLYLNPIFESHSNHRYDTADYRHIDPLLGTRDDLKKLIAKAKRRGMRVLLDGVFSHTGADSVYFNKNGRYDSVGAYQSLQSPYASWYHFTQWPNAYDGWWGFNTLPEVDELNEQFLAFITGKDGVLDYWLQTGIGGWRLDVADDLPDAFLESLRTRVKAVDPDGIVIGEVWEDASNKQSYGHRRRYLLGRQLDSVMNYPFREAILQYLKTGKTALFFDGILTVLENYPPQVVRVLMNFLGTHDTERAITLLAGVPANGRGRSWQAETTLSPSERKHGEQLLRLAAALLYTLPGVPCIYYGDETGMEGYRDPFNRGCFPWDRMNEDLISWYRSLGDLRKTCTAFIDGAFTPAFENNGALGYTRQDDRSTVLCAVNPTNHDVIQPLDAEWHSIHKGLGEAVIRDGMLYLPPFSCGIFRRKKK